MTAASDRGTETVRPELVDAADAAYFALGASTTRVGRTQAMEDAVAAVLPLLTAADVPHIEAAVRGKVAQEIEHEAARERARGGLDKQREGNVLDRAAALARGVAS